MTQYQKFIIKISFLVILSTGIFLYGQYSQIRTKAIEEEKNVVARYIQGRASALLLPEDFSTQDKAHQKIAFEGFFDSIQSPEMVRLKVWDKNYRIIWSNLDGLMGQQFLDNREVQEAFEGEIEFEIENQKAENFSERDYAELAEVYIPVSDSEKGVVGVLEVYKSTVYLNEKINREFRAEVFFVSVVAFSFFVLLAVAGRYLFNDKKKRS